MENTTSLIANDEPPDPLTLRDLGKDPISINLNTTPLPPDDYSPSSIPIITFPPLKPATHPSSLQALPIVDPPLQPNPLMASQPKMSENPTQLPDTFLSSIVKIQDLSDFPIKIRSGEINPAELYKKNYTNKDGVWTSKEQEKFISLFTLKVLTCPLPQHFRPPVIDIFDGSGDPCDHMEIFRLRIHVQSYEDPILCRAFSLTLEGSAQRWFSSLPSRTVEDFNILISNRCIKRPSTYLFSNKQNPKESLRSYIARVNRKVVIVSHTTDKAKFMALNKGLQSSNFLKYPMRKTPTNFVEAKTKAQKHIDFEHMFATHLHSMPLEQGRDRDVDRHRYRDQQRRIGRDHTPQPIYND
ncbi:hypothetical protein CJ030_MR7G017421 [Morella rubra]|uniref:Retrotransposon gag domain-containing protein n=1 Tax=Morella rubra TaxID=262757 RepID=A0A6A1V599_9ROSI|nr:hypothetical protein CJ030_MR7G017421 [Morella rubra]